ncbi:MAG: acyl-CoA dehydrogenase family protein, partial [Paracoccaceae bacterium]
DQSGLQDAIRQIEALPNLRVAGLHVYMGTRILSHVTVYENTVQILALARQVQTMLANPLDFVDIGGGFGVAYHEGEPDLDLAALAAAITPELDRFRAASPGTAIAIELGRYMVAAAGRFVTRVRRVKYSKGEGFAVCDGGSSVHSAAAGQGSFLRKNFPIHLASADPAAPQRPVGDWTLTGPLCTPMDVIGRDVVMQTPAPGDLICIDQSGAYGPTASPVNFLGFGAPAEVMVDGDALWVVRAPVPHSAILDDQTPRSPTLNLLPPLSPTWPPLTWPADSPFACDCLDSLAQLGPLFQRTGANLEDDPDAWRDLWADPVVRALTTIGVPDAFNGFPLTSTVLGISECSYGLHVAIIERLARLDASCILALPGPSLSGGAVLRVGSAVQVERFFAAYRHGPQGTFFAVTEPDAGSDASNGKTRVSIKDGGAVLNGTKMLVGGVARAAIGLVFCHLEQAGRTGLVMVDVARFDRHIRVERLETSGLAGADLCRVTFTDLPVDPSMILGDGGPSLRDGFMAINGVFERNRPVVAAIALGAGRGILDMLRSNQRVFADFEDLDLGHKALLGQLAGVVAAYEGGRPRAHDISLIKMQAVAFADKV